MASPPGDLPHCSASCPTTAPDLISCSAFDLATHLLKHRFSNDAVATSSFLLECTSVLPNTDRQSEKTMADASVERIDLGDARHDKAIGISMVYPRGKLSCTFHENGLSCLTNKLERVQVAHSNVQRIVIFPKPEDCRTAKNVRDMVLIVLQDDGIKFNSKPQSQLCFQLPPIDCPNGDSWIDLFCDSFHLDKSTDVAHVPHPKQKIESNRKDYNFKSFSDVNSSSTTAAMPYVTCYQGVHDGVLYPMKEGLLFFKPPRFIPRSRLHSIACGRGGNSKYVDLICTLDDDTPLEFSNIARDEMVVLNEYIHGTLIPAMGTDSNGHCVVGVKADVDVDEETDDDKDTRVKRRSKRKGIREARAATKSQLVNSKNVREDDNDDDDHEDDDDDNDNEDDEDYGMLQTSSDDDDDDDDDDNDDDDDDNDDDDNDDDDNDDDGDNNDDDVADHENGIDKNEHAALVRANDDGEDGYKNKVITAKVFIESDDSDDSKNEDAFKAPPVKRIKKEKD